MPSAGTQEVLSTLLWRLFTALHMQIAFELPFPHRAVECFVAHASSAAASREMGSSHQMATVGDQSGRLFADGSPDRVEGKP